MDFLNLFDLFQGDVVAIVIDRCIADDFFRLYLIVFKWLRLIDFANTLNCLWLFLLIYGIRLINYSNLLIFLEKFIMVWNAYVVIINIIFHIFHIVSILTHSLSSFCIIPFPFDIDKTILMISFKLFMFKNVNVWIISYFVKIIHIQLSNKWCKISVSKMSWQNLLLKSLDIINDKVVALLVPWNNSLVFLVLKKMVKIK